MTTATDEELDLLLELSDVDARRARTAAKLADLPEQQAVEEAVARARAETEAGDALRVEVTTLEAEQRRLERDVEQYRQRLAHERERLYGGGVTNAKEMQSVEAEIATVEGRIAGHEDQLLAAMEATEELAERIEQSARLVEQIGAEVVALESARDDAAGVLLAEQAELDVERDRLRAGLGPDALAAYDAVRARVTAGAAVGQLSGMSCSACRIELPHAEVNELRDGDPLATCPSCRRLLVVR